jgi:AcrR family transcriptional regulator
MDVKETQGEATRTQLIATARKLFGERGYAAVGTEEIVRSAGVTRGALYHHFEGKADLFRAVFEEMEGQLAERIAREALSQPDAWEAHLAGLEMFLDACLEPEIQRIALLDAPSVLGWQTWREIEARYWLGLIKASLEGLIEAGVLPEQPVEPLAQTILGALAEAGLYVAGADDVPAARAETSAVVRRLLEGLRVSEND